MAIVLMCVFIDSPVKSLHQFLYHGPCVNFGNFMAGNFLGGNFLAGNFLSHVVIFGNFMAGKLFGRKLFGPDSEYLHFYTYQPPLESNRVDVEFLHQVKLMVHVLQ